VRSNPRPVWSKRDGLLCSCKRTVKACYVAARSPEVLSSVSQNCANARSAYAAP